MDTNLHMTALPDILSNRENKIIQLCVPLFKVSYICIIKHLGSAFNTFLRLTSHCKATTICIFLRSSVCFTLSKHCLGLSKFDLNGPNLDMIWCLNYVSFCLANNYSGLSWFIHSKDCINNVVESRFFY